MSAEPRDTRRPSHLEAALLYAARGWPVLPVNHPLADRTCSCRDPNCESIGKHPYGLLAPHGIDDASTDPETIRLWWARAPHASIGVLTGGKSGLVVLDVDPRNGGDDTLAALEREHGVLPETVEALTGGGGRDILFAHPGGYIKSKAGALGPGLDIKADGGYIVVEPSVHVSGRSYRWEVAHHPDDMQLAPMPAWMLTRLNGDEWRAKESSTEGAAPIPEGGRHDALLAIAGALRAKGLSGDAILAALRVVNAERCPPHLLPDTEVTRIARDMGAKPPGSDPAGQAIDKASRAETFAKASRRAADLVAAEVPEPVSILGRGVLVQGALGLLFGPPGSHKTWLALDLALRVSRGERWAGILTTMTRAAYVALELPTYFARERLLRIAGSDRDGLDNLFLFTIPDVVGINLDDDATLGAVEAFVKAEGIGFLIIDPLARAHAADENDGKAMRLLLARLDALRARTGVTIALVHHSRKAPREGKDLDLDAARGSSVLASHPSLLVRIGQDRGLITVRFPKVSFGRDPGVLWFKKSDDGPPILTDAPQQAKDAKERNVEAIGSLLDSKAGRPVAKEDIERLPLAGKDGEPVQWRTRLRYLGTLRKAGRAHPVGHGRNAQWAAGSDGRPLSHLGIATGDTGTLALS